MRSAIVLLLALLGSVGTTACTMVQPGAQPSDSADPSDDDGSSTECNVADDSSEGKACKTSTDCPAVDCECADGTKADALQSCSVGTNGNGECASFTSCRAYCLRNGTEICGGDPEKSKGKTSTPSPNDEPADGSFPTALRVTGQTTFKNLSSLSSDKTKLTTLLTGNLPHAMISPTVDTSTFTPNLDAATVITIYNPGLGDCTVVPTISIGSGGNVIMSFQAVDTLPAHACSDWGALVAKDGIEVQYEGVPYGNSSSTAVVTVKLTP